MISSSVPSPMYMASMYPPAHVGALMHGWLRTVTPAPAVVLGVRLRAPAPARQTTSQEPSSTMSLKSEQRLVEARAAVDDILLAVADAIRSSPAPPRTASPAVSSGPSRPRARARTAGRCRRRRRSRRGPRWRRSRRCRRRPAGRRRRGRRPGGRAALAVGRVVARAGEQPVAPVAAEQLVVARAAEQAIAADRSPPFEHVARGSVRRPAAVEPVGAGLAVAACRCPGCPRDDRRRAGRRCGRRRPRRGPGRGRLRRAPRRSGAARTRRCPRARRSVSASVSRGDGRARGSRDVLRDGRRERSVDSSATAPRERRTALARIGHGPHLLDWIG